jgi:hypothetical protein
MTSFACWLVVVDNVIKGRRHSVGAFDVQQRRWQPRHRSRRRCRRRIITKTLVGLACGGRHNIAVCDLQSEGCCRYGSSAPSPRSLLLSLTTVVAVRDTDQRHDRGSDMAYLDYCPGPTFRAPAAPAAPETAPIVKEVSGAEARVLQATGRPALLSRRQQAGQKGCRHGQR